MDDNTVCIAVGLRLDLQRDSMQPKDLGKLKVAAAAEERKEEKYSSLPPSHWFSPIAIETLGAVGPKSMALLMDVGYRIVMETEILTG